MNKKKGKLLFFVTEDWYFCSHRLPVAVAAIEAGYEIVLVTRIQKHANILSENGIRVVPIGLRRNSKNPFKEISTIFEIWKICYSEKPDILHNVAIKPVLYGSIVGFFSRKIKIVNAIAGFGYIFSSDKWQAKLIRPFVKNAFRNLLGRENCKCIVQNPDDKFVLTKSLDISSKQIALIKGSGVDLRNYKPQKEPVEPVVLTLVARMLWDKGIGEFVESVKILREKGYNISANLVGKPDSDNPGSINEHQLKTWHSSGAIKWSGFKSDVAEIWSKSHIAVLPSYYGEGVPKCLIEAAACGRPIVTTDMPGCREIVKNQINGILVPPKDANALADALAILISDKGMREKMGQCGRELVEKEYSIDMVVNQTLDVYSELLK